MRTRLALILLLAILSVPTFSSMSEAQTSAQDDPELLISIIEDIRTGWETADGTPFKTHYLDFRGARYIESGGQNKGLDDLIHHHVEPEGDVLDGLSLSFTNIETHFEGVFAWAIADVIVKATVKADGRKIHRKGYETFLFRSVEGSWKVVHTHSSTREVEK